MNKKFPIILAGPTGCGKSSIALELAKKFSYEIICADSRQIYKYMRIGVAGPTDVHLNLVRHHCYNIIDLTEVFNVAKFINICDLNIDKLKNQKKNFILVGGSGLYLKLFRYGLSNIPASNKKIRKQFELILKKHNVRFLYERLKLIDKHVANKISSNDSIRIIRALEINQITGKKPSSLFKCFYKQDIRIKANWVLCWPEYLWLVKRLIKRIDNMFHQGLIEEAVLLRNKLHVNHRLLHTIGYEEALLVNDNKLSLENAKARILLRQTHYAKKQYTWFKKEKWWNRVNPSLINVIDIISKIII